MRVLCATFACLVLYVDAIPCENHKQNYCTALPTALHQPPCSSWGDGYEYDGDGWCAWLVSGYWSCVHRWNCDQPYATCKMGEWKDAEKPPISGKDDGCIFPERTELFLNMVMGAEADATGGTRYEKTEEEGISSSDESKDTHTTTSKFALGLLHKIGDSILLPVEGGEVKSNEETPGTSDAEWTESREHFTSAASLTSEMVKTVKSFTKEEGHPMYIYQAIVKTYYSDGSDIVHTDTQKGSLFATEKKLGISVTLVPTEKKFGISVTLKPEEEGDFDVPSGIVSMPPEQAPDNVPQASMPSDTREATNLAKRVAMEDLANQYQYQNEGIVTPSRGYGFVVGSLLLLLVIIVSVVGGIRKWDVEEDADSLISDE